MRHIDEDTITQAVIARHAAAGDARLREVMTSLVQHLHAFARDVELSEAEWAAVAAVLADCSRRPRHLGQELGLLSDALGLSALVSAQARRAAKFDGTAPASTLAPFVSGGEIERGFLTLEDCPPVYLVGRVCSRDGEGVPSARVRAWPSPSSGVGCSDVRTDADGHFWYRTDRPTPYSVAGDGLAGRLLAALGRPLWRPAHLYVAIGARGYRTLVTHLFPEHSKYLEQDPLFAVRPSLVVPWVGHGSGERAPDGQHCSKGFTTVEFTFVLEEEAAADATPLMTTATTGDKP
jgi:hydroxyquinol 1,2-dioxygenase